MVYAALQAMKAKARIDPRHSDGGASQWHGGLTLVGKRAVRVFLDNAADTASGGSCPVSDVLLRQEPGDFYLGALCSAEHQVEHYEPADAEPLLRDNADDEGGLQCATTNLNSRAPLEKSASKLSASFN